MSYSFSKSYNLYFTFFEIGWKHKTIDQTFSKKNLKCQTIPYCSQKARTICEGKRGTAERVLEALSWCGLLIYSARHAHSSALGPSVVSGGVFQHPLNPRSSYSGSGHSIKWTKLLYLSLRHRVAPFRKVQEGLWCW